MSDNNFEIDLPNIKVGAEDKKKTEAPKADAKKKVVEVLMMLKEKADVISQLKEADPQAFQAVMKVVQALTDIAQQGLIKKMPEFSVEESSESSPEFFEQSKSEKSDLEKNALDPTAEDDFWNDIASNMKPEDGHVE